MSAQHPEQSQESTNVRYVDLDRVPETLTGLYSAHSDRALVVLLGELGVVNAPEAFKTLDNWTTETVSLQHVVPETFNVSLDLEDRDHISEVKEVARAQSNIHPDWRSRASFISDLLKNEEREKQEIAEFGGIKTIGMEESLPTHALIGMPTRITITRADAENSLQVKIDGLSDEGKDATVLLARDLDAAYSSGEGWRVVDNKIDGTHQTQELSSQDRSEALLYVLSSAARKANS